MMNTDLCAEQWRTAKHEARGDVAAMLFAYAQVATNHGQLFVLAEIGEILARTGSEDWEAVAATILEGIDKANEARGVEE